ncbi:hemolysin-III channel protein Izh2 [Cordyceps fumosorosea ARSEF 2679]|uniref:Hemolysin-III channel protein Izh2 n=1 Tax=Cordyceps fumosorosea (strain ARSEF 2679) TaxID=1081104 RepID=A0A162IB28_CORFA|nr:hemolysin-III channel protein Izh2 [Cordyceps fumosorosea ARSEF 2679]OAA54635.1 hemolysin-III channel protein Izh2 [Cordyceps fumosorosea ARSEF 2679]
MTTSTVRQRRPSLTTSAIHAASQGLQSTTRTVLHLFDDLPAWRRDNAFIHGGYRPIRPSYTHAARSLLYLHNESVNIWTHLLGCLGALAAAAHIFHVVRPRYEAAHAGDVAVFACFFGGAVACLGMSAAFHTLLDHSAAVARWGNKLDYTGIVALIVGSYVPALYYGFFCEPVLFWAYLYVMCALGVACATVSWVERFRTSAWRPYRASMFIGLGLSGVVPILLGVRRHGYQHYEDRMGLSWVILQGALYIFGAVLYAARWPERSFPGKVDIWGSSHQIFHVFVLLAAATHFYGMAKAFDYHHTGNGSLCP